MSEFSFIYKHFSKLSKNKQNFLNDGCEIQVENGKKLVVTKDILISNVHFFKEDNPNFIAQKSLRKNLSDLAAMGAKPYGYLLGISLPQNTNEKFVEEFCKGLRIVQGLYGLDLLGGDTNTNKNEMIIISITMFGMADKNNHLMPRNNGQKGDKIYISGQIGNGCLGYLVHQNKIKIENSEFFLNNFLYGNCRNDIGEKLNNKANSCIDISDGLLQDLMHLCHDSNLSAKIYSEKIPINKNIKILIDEGNIRFLDLLKWGDDYELLFCGDSNKLDKINGIYEIGEMIESKENEFEIFLDDKKVDDWKGFEHF